MTPHPRALPYPGGRARRLPATLHAWHRRQLDAWTACRPTDVRNVCDVHYRGPAGFDESRPFDPSHRDSCAACVRAHPAFGLGGTGLVVDAELPEVEL